MNGKRCEITTEQRNNDAGMWSILNIDAAPAAAVLVRALSRGRECHREGGSDPLYCLQLALGWRRCI